MDALKIHEINGLDIQQKKKKKKKREINGLDFGDNVGWDGNANPPLSSALPFFSFFFLCQIIMSIDG